MIASTEIAIQASQISRNALGGGRAATKFEFSLVLEASCIEEIEPEPAEWTVDNVKREFYGYLDSLIISPGLAGTSISVNITDAAFEKMLSYPEYMQKMKDLCARDLCDPRWNKIAAMGRAPSASVITIDADCEEEYLASSLHGESDRRKAESGEDFWNRRKEKHQAMLERQQKKAAERRELLELILQRSSERRNLFQSSAVASDVFPASVSRETAISSGAVGTNYKSVGIPVLFAFFRLQFGFGGYESVDTHFY